MRLLLSTLAGLLATVIGTGTGTQAKTFHDSSPYSYCQANFPAPSTYPFISSPNVSYVAVQLITRHGDRTPVNIMPHDDAVWKVCSKYANWGFANSATPAHGPQLYIQKRPIVSGHNPYASQLWDGTCMAGQLTDIGISQHIKLGDELRSIYIDKLNVLPSLYDSSKLYVRSTDVWRTHQTAESLLTGLYPPQATNTQQGDEVIPIYTYPDLIETMYINPVTCLSFAALSSRMCDDPMWKKHLTDNHDLIVKLCYIFQVEVTSSWAQSFDHIYDNLRARECHGQPRPCITDSNGVRTCVTEEDAARVYAAADWEYMYKYLGYNQTSVAQLGISAFTQTISDLIDAHVTQATTGKPHQPSIPGGGDPIDMTHLPKLAYYSGHDATLAAVLGAYDVKGWRWPPYASNFLIELLHDSSRPSPLSQFYVRVIYNGVQVRLPFCSSLDCDYYEWTNYQHTIIPHDIQQACKQDTPNNSNRCLT